MELPQAFKEKMERLLGAEYTEFLESYEKERKQGLRLNLLKTSRKKFEQEAPFSLSPIPWTEEGYYYGKEDRPGTLIDTHFNRSILMNIITSYGFKQAHRIRK